MQKRREVETIRLQQIHEGQEMNEKKSKIDSQFNSWKNKYKREIAGN